MAIYTRTGDKGFTTRYDGSRVPKNDFSITIIGKIDNLLASLDSALVSLKEKKKKEFIQEIQKKLWQTAGEISLGKPGKKIVDEIKKEDIVNLEDYIDDNTLNFKYFIRFTTENSTRLNEARVRCRELEVALTKYYQEKKVRPEIYQYINRLSDLLYIMACNEN